jgi:hypothetical protein
LTKSCNCDTATWFWWKSPQAIHRRPVDHLIDDLDERRIA